MAAPSPWSKSLNLTPNKQRQVICAVVGCGYWGKHYVRITHTRPELNCKYICDGRPELLAPLLEQYPSANPTADLQEVLDDPTVEAVFVVVPATAHYSVVTKCLEAGKHVLVEKPLTVTSEFARKLVELQKQSERTVLVGHTYLYNSTVRYIHDLLHNPEASHKLGRLHTIYARRTNLGPPKPDGTLPDRDVNVLWDLGPHDVSIFQYCMNREMPVKVNLTGQNVMSPDGLLDVAFLTLYYASGVIGQIHVSWVDPHKARDIVFVGTQARVVMDDMNPQESLRIYKTGFHDEGQREILAAANQPETAERRLVFRDGDIVCPLIRHAEPLQTQVLDFVRAIRNNDKPSSDCEIGAQVVVILEKACESFEKGVTVEIGAEWRANGSATNGA